MMHNHLFHQENLLLKMYINFVRTLFTLVASFANGHSVLPIWHIKHLVLHMETSFYSFLYLVKHFEADMSTYM